MIFAVSLSCTSQGLTQFSQDNVWSSQQQEQIIGRIHRKPNKKECRIYIPRLYGTSDMELGQLASVKEMLLSMFVGE